MGGVGGGPFRFSVKRCESNCEIFLFGLNGLDNGSKVTATSSVDCWYCLNSPPAPHDPDKAIEDE